MTDTPPDLPALATSLTAAAHSCEEARRVLFEYSKSWPHGTPIHSALGNVWYEAYEANRAVERVLRKLNEAVMLIAERNRRAALTPEQLAAEDEAATYAELKRVLRKRGRNALLGPMRLQLEAKLKAYETAMAAQGLVVHRDARNAVRYAKKEAHAIAKQHFNSGVDQ
jgi:hypothetical protein